MSSVSPPPSLIGVRCAPEETLDALHNPRSVGQPFLRQRREGVRQRPPQRTMRAHKG
jgi:hypothetical protein